MAKMYGWFVFPFIVRFYRSFVVMSWATRCFALEDDANGADHCRVD